MVDDIELAAVQWVREETDQAYARQRVAGLDGTLHLKVGRSSHRVMLSGLLVTDTAADDLAALQEKAQAGTEVTFTADITTALEVQKMVIESFAAEQDAGTTGRFAYCLVLAESPPLPPPATLSAFGGLDDFGMGDLGFDPGALGDVLGDIADAAGTVMDSVDSALDAVAGLADLASLADFGDFGNPLAPLLSKVGDVTALAPNLSGVVGSLGELFG